MRKKLGLSGKLVLMILFSALASAVFLVGMQVVLNKALWLYFDQPETQQRAVEKQVQELQSYIDRRGLSSRDIDKLDDWSVRNGSTMFIIYDRSRMLYSSYPLVAPVYEGRENVTEAVPAERWLPMYSLTFSDKETTAMFYYNGVDAYYGKGCEILLLVSFALFPLFFFLSSRKIIRYILLLSGEIQAMEGGDLDHPITIQGDDGAGPAGHQSGWSASDPAPAAGRGGSGCRQGQEPDHRDVPRPAHPADYPAALY